MGKHVLNIPDIFWSDDHKEIEIKFKNDPERRPHIIRGYSTFGWNYDYFIVRTDTNKEYVFLVRDIDCVEIYQTSVMDEENSNYKRVLLDSFVFEEYK